MANKETFITRQWRRDLCKPEDLCQHGLEGENPKQHEIGKTRSRIEGRYGSGRKQSKSRTISVHQPLGKTPGCEFEAGFGDVSKVKRACHKLGWEKCSYSQGNTDLLARDIPKPEEAKPSKYTEVTGIFQTSTDKTFFLIRKKNRPYCLCFLSCRHVCLAVLLLEQHGGELAICSPPSLNCRQLS